MIRLSYRLASQGRRTEWLNHETLYRWIEGLECAGASSKSPATSSNVTEGSNTATSLTNEFLSGTVVMRTKIATKVELVRTKRAPFFHHPLSLLLDQIKISSRDLAWNRLWQLIDKNDLRTKSPHHARALRRITLRHNSDKRVPLNRADDRKSCSGITTGKLDYRLPLMQQALCLSFLDHVERNTILFRKSWVEVVKLHDTRAFEIMSEARQFNDRRLTDRIQHRIQNTYRMRHAKVTTQMRRECAYVSR